jgi:hypothetical protein
MQKLVMFRSAASAPAAASATASSSGESFQDYTMIPGAPTKEMLSALTAVPAGLLNMWGDKWRSGGRKKHKMRHSRIAREGEIVTHMFNQVGARPYPSFGLSLEQGIRVQLTMAGQVFTTSTTVPVYTSFQFTLNGLYGYSAYVGLFDQYMFEQVEIWLEPVQVPAGTTLFGNLATAIDLDDATTPSSYAQVAEKQGAVVGVGSDGRYMRFRPHVAVAVYSGTFTSFANAPSTWIDSASTAVNHYGFKVAAGASGTAVNYEMTARCIVSFRAPGIA